MLYLGADHAGYLQKEALKKVLLQEGVELKDVGTNSTEPVDYPLIAQAALEHFQPATDQAILLCGSGEGMAVAANKINGVRAAVVWNERVARETREDNDSNVLSIPSRYVSTAEAIAIAKTFLATSFSKAQRHQRRIQEVTDLEQP